MAIVRVFFDTDLRNGSRGFTEILKENRIAAASLGEADFVLFLNRKRTGMKLFWNETYVLTYHKQQGQITVEDIRKVPAFFRGAGFLNSRIDKQLSKYINKSTLVSVDERNLRVG